jgi:hypothetical protein
MKAVLLSASERVLPVVSSEMENLAVFTCVYRCKSIKSIFMKLFAAQFDSMV